MMKQAWMLLILLALACGSAGATSFVDWGDGYTYACYDNHADTQGNNWYAWALRNESYTSEIVTWTWAGGVVGVLPGSESLEAEFPLPVATGIRPWYNTFYRSDEPSTTVMSTIWWSDGTTASVPVVMPVSVVPEPTGLIALAASLVALCGIRRRGKTSRP
jgi:hypothetical protein